MNARQGSKIELEQLKIAVRWLEAVNRAAAFGVAQISKSPDMRADVYNHRPYAQDLDGLTTR